MKQFSKILELTRALKSASNRKKAADDAVAIATSRAAAAARAHQDAEMALNVAWRDIRATLEAQTKD